MLLDDWQGETLYSADVTLKTRDGDLASYSGETLLGRLSRQRFSNAVFQSGPMFAENALATILLAAGVPYVSPLPVFYLRGSSSLIRPELKAVTVAWDEGEDAPTVRDAIEELLGAFDGYVVRANSSDVLEVIAPSWATGAGAVVMLTLDDVLESGWVIEETDNSVINLCTVRSSSYDFVEDQTVAADAALECGWDSSSFPDLGTAPERERGVWSATSAYIVNDAATFDGTRYRCTSNVGPSASDPSVDTTHWAVSRFNGWLNIGSGGFVSLETGVFTEGDLEVEVVLTVVDYRNPRIPNQQ
ncbi:MAG: hypothetical protein HC933_02160 [Pleurocapsa sp. SU_196_0]|nr:hypothetical protein [Pleurocapsa sp. SU_196_0]